MDYRNTPAEGAHTIPYALVGYQLVFPPWLVRLLSEEYKTIGCMALVRQESLPQFTMGFYLAVLITFCFPLAFTTAVALDPGLSVANVSNGTPSLWAILSPGDSRIECYEHSRPVNEYSCYNAWSKIEISVELFRAADRALPESHANPLPYRWLSGKLRCQNHDKHREQTLVSFSCREMDGLSYSSGQKQIGSR